MTEAEILEQKLLNQNKRKTERNSITSIEMRQSILVNNDMKYFKDDILKEVKKIKKELFEKFNEFSNEVNEKINKASHDNEEIEEKLEHISKSFDNKIAAFFNHNENNALEKTISELKDNLLTNEIKIQTVREDLKSHKDTYGDIIKNNIFYHGLIGPGCKYRDMHQFIDYLNLSLTELTTMINQKGSEIKSNKKKTDYILNNINSQISEITFGYKSYMNQSIKDLNTKINEDLKKIEDELNEMKEKNINYIKKMDSKLEEYNDKYKNRVTFENNITEKNEKAFDDLKESNTKLITMVEDYKKELKEIKDQYNELINSNREIKSKLNPFNLFYRKNNLENNNSPKNDQNLLNKEIENIKRFIKIRKFRNQSTDSFGEIYGDKNSYIENSVPNGPFSQIFLKMSKDKNGLKVSQKILRNERLEKFNYLYNDNNQSEYYVSNRSLDNIKPVYSDNTTQNKIHNRASSSMAGMRTRKIKKETKKANHSTRDFYDVGLYVNFKNKNEENYIKDLKNNNNNNIFKYQEKVFKITPNYSTKFTNKNSKNPKDFLCISKNIQKDRFYSSKQSSKEKNYFNKSFNKKANNNLEENKYNEFIKKGENDIALAIKEKKKEILFRNSKNKIKIKNLTAIE